MKYLSLLLIGVILAFTSNAQSEDRKSILSILQHQSEAWNRGNIDEFMKG